MFSYRGRLAKSKDSTKVGKTPRGSRAVDSLSPHVLLIWGKSESCRKEATFDNEDKCCS